MDSDILLPLVAPDAVKAGEEEEEGVPAQLLKMHCDLRCLLDGQARIETALQAVWQNSLSARRALAQAQVQGPNLASSESSDGVASPSTVDGAQHRSAQSSGPGRSPRRASSTDAHISDDDPDSSKPLMLMKSGASVARPRRQQSQDSLGSGRGSNSNNPVRFVKMAPCMSSTESSGTEEIDQGSSTFNRRSAADMHAELLPRTYDTRPVGMNNLLARGSASSDLHAPPDRMADQSAHRWIPVHPTCAARVAFDLVSIMLILYDSIMVPFTLAWNIKPEGDFFWIMTCTTGFWIVDSMLSFVTGYRDGDDLVMSIPMIIRHYLRGWFAADFLTVACDLIELISSAAALGSSGGSETTFVRIARFAKIGRSMRIIAKFRMGLFQRVDELLRHFAGKIGLAAHLSFILLAVKLVFLILWMNHVGTCIWYSTGHFPGTDTGLSWQRTLTEDDSYEAFPDRFMYLTGMYWTTAVMFGGEAFMPPSNTAEAVFTQLYIVFGALFVSSLTSSLAAILVENQMLEQEKTSKLQKLMRFLHQNKVSTMLAISVREQAQKHMNSEKRLCAEDVRGTMRLLSRSLQVDLRVHLFRMHFTKCSFLKTCDILEDTTVSQLCYAAADRMYAPGDEVFAEREESTRSYMCIAGTLRYVQATNGDDVGPGHWICEQTFWTHWRTLGTLEAATSCEILSISTQAFAKAVFNHPGLVRFVRLYSKRMWEAIMNEQLASQSDLRTNIDDAGIMAVMPHDIREIVSLHFLANGAGAWNVLNIFENTRKGKEALEEEIKDGKCHLTEAVEGTQNVLLRVVHLVVLRLTSADNLLCVRVAKWRNGIGRPAFALPACKVQKDEDPSDTLTRLYQEELNCIGQDLTVESHEVMVERAASASYGMDTKYIRRVYFASLSEFEAQKAVPIAAHSTVDPVRGRRVRSDAWKPFALQSGDNVAIFAWMPENDFTYLSADEARSGEFVSAWLQGVRAQEIEAMVQIGVDLAEGQDA